MPVERCLRRAERAHGRFRGGLAQVNVLQSIVFAGMSGSAIADAAGSGKMMQYMMTKDGRYTPSFFAAVIGFIAWVARFGLIGSSPSVQPNGVAAVA